jgi:hypothetical protein
LHKGRPKRLLLPDLSFNDSDLRVQPGKGRRIGSCYLDGRRLSSQGRKLPTQLVDDGRASLRGSGRIDKTALLSKLN